MSIIAGRMIQSRGYQAQGVNFDGSNDYLTRGAELTGNADGKVGTVSFWFNTTATGVVFIMSNETAGTPSFTVDLDSGERIQVFGENAAGTQILNIASSINRNDGAWHHFVATWDMANDNKFIFLDDVSDLTENTFTDDTIDYTEAAWSIGAQPDGTSKYTGDIADLWFALEYFDINVTANRRRFVTSDVKPVNLGSDGSAPTGTAAIILCSGPTVAWHTNDGAGGGFTENGALTDSATNP